jgi:hypothetical protein
MYPVCKSGGVSLFPDLHDASSYCVSLLLECFSGFHSFFFGRAAIVKWNKKRCQICYHLFGVTDRMFFLTQKCFCL